jgi:Effector-associated domain 2
MVDASINLECMTILSSEERQTLVDLLWRCNSMSRREARNVVVDDLPDEIRKAMKRDLQNDKLDIRLIVQICQDYLGVQQP